MRKSIVFITGFLCFLTISVVSSGQPGSTIEIRKPEKYENRTLGSEKTGDKKFSFPRNVLQNTFTHYNYVFNAKTKLTDIIDQAKQSFKEDYTKLLPFFNYSLDVTSTSGDIDSIIYKCNTGIVLHDLRNDWVDNLYLLLGEAYFLRKDFDSAAYVFQYINYAFAPKEEGGYDIPVGSNISNDRGVFSVATKEKNSFPANMVEVPPSRNDALLWKARTFIETGRYEEASSLLQILKNDPVFPERLQPRLNHLFSYLFYVRGNYDSSATFLEKSFDVASDNSEKARMQYLTAQMYQLIDSTDKAVHWYSKSSSLATDPLLQVNANLNVIRLTGNKGDEKLATEKLDNLKRMARRDKYFSQRDLIYYAIAQAEIERNDTAAAKEMLKKSIRYNEQENPAQRSISFMLLGDLDYSQQAFEPAKQDYDSVNGALLADAEAQARLQQRLPALETVTENLQTIHVQDSLQTLALLPKNERDAAVRKMVRYLRKLQGLNEEPEMNINPAVQQQAASDLFANNAAGRGNNASSDWYFNNLALKSSGFNEFKSKWGNRPNVDNWQRQAAIAAQNVQANPNANPAGNQPSGEPVPGQPLEDPLLLQGDQLNFDALYAYLPLSEEQLKGSNEEIANALFSIAETFQNKLENYPAAIKYYEELLEKYKDNARVEEAMANLYFCYLQSGKRDMADEMLANLRKQFPNSRYLAKINNKSAVSSESASTAAYQNIYNLFIEGKFEEAKAAKAKADSLYGNSYWTPQLLYIESIYYVSNREDSIAIDRLEDLMDLYSDSPLAQKAQTMIDVLNRRAEIEDYLTRLQITRYPEDSNTQVVDLTPVRPTIQKPDVKNDSLVNNTVSQPTKLKVDSATGKTIEARVYTFNAKEPQYAAIVLDQVAPVYINEAKNAFNRFNQISFYREKLQTNPVKISDRYHLVLIGPFAGASEAADYISKTKPVTASRILPWLPADKYSFMIISENNLDIMKETTDIESYKKLLDEVLPGMF